MKDISGIDENGKPKNGSFKLFFKNGLVSCQGEFDNGKKSGKWKYFLNNGQMQSSGSYKDGKLLVVGNGFSKMVSREEQVASTMMSKNMAHGSDTMLMANCGMKVALNTERRRALGKFMTRRANS